MAYILSIDTGTDICSVALSKNGELLSLCESTDNRMHARNLAVFINEILEGNNLDPEDLDAVAVSKGPGSYTGLRIGVSTAKGLCYGLGKPLIAINSLMSMANVAIEDYQNDVLDVENPETAVLAPMIDARRMEVYTQLYNMKLEPLTEIEAHIIAPDSFREFIQSGEFIMFGDGAEKCVETVYDKNVKLYKMTTSARGMVQLAHKAFDAGQFEDVAYFEPFYLKNFIALKSKKKMF